MANSRELEQTLPRVVRIRLLFVKIVLKCVPN